MKVEFLVPGEPKSKGRPRFRRVGQAVSTYTPAKTAKAEAEVLRAMGPVARRLEGALSLGVTAVFPIPKSVTKVERAARQGQFYTGPKDLDNVVKLVQDALNGVLFEDDRQIAEINAVARWAESYEAPMVMVSVAELEGRHAQG